jgi:hypothetical protein
LAICIEPKKHNILFHQCFNKWHTACIITDMRKLHSIHTRRIFSSVWYTPLLLGKILAMVFLLSKSAVVGIQQQVMQDAFSFDTQYITNKHDTDYRLYTTSSLKWANWTAEPGRLFRKTSVASSSAPSAPLTVQLKKKLLSNNQRQSHRIRCSKWN